MNNKRERFKKYAESRTNEVLKKLQVLGNCSNKSAYEFTDEEIGRIFFAIDKATKETKAKFNLSNNKKFKL